MRICKLRGVNWAIIARLGQAVGYLVFPRVIKFGIGVGAETGKGVLRVGGGKTIDTDNARDPVVGFIFGSKGLMYNLTLEGSKFTKLDKS